MAFIERKRLIDSDGKILTSINDEILLSLDYIDGYIPLDEINEAIKGGISYPLFRLFILNTDETIKEDISKYVITDKSSLSMNYQQGQTRSFNLTLYNPYEETYDINNNSVESVKKLRWFPSPVNGTIWKGTKFRLDLGVATRTTAYWVKSGVFVCATTSLSGDRFNPTVSLQLYDKFSLLDGTVGGRLDSNTDGTYKINVNSNIEEAVRSLLLIDRGDGEPYDAMPVVFPNKYQDEKTPYTITKTSKETVGDLLTELANMLSCDLYYNENGNLVFEDNSERFPLENNPVLFVYRDNELMYTNANIEVDYQNVVNKVIVIGCNVNGKLYKGIAINTNPKSQSNIYMTPPNIKTIEDENIYSDSLALERAKYELSKLSMLLLSVDMSSLFVPYLQVKKLVIWNNKDYGFENQKFVIQSLGLRNFRDFFMDIKMINVDEVAMNV